MENNMEYWMNMEYKKYAEKTVFGNLGRKLWYNAKHGNEEDLMEILNNAYRVAKNVEYLEINSKKEFLRYLKEERFIYDGEDQYHIYEVNPVFQIYEVLLIEKDWVNEEDAVKRLRKIDKVLPQENMIKLAEMVMFEACGYFVNKSYTHKKTPIGFFEYVPEDILEWTYNKIIKCKGTETFIKNTINITLTILHEEIPNF